MILFPTFSVYTSILGASSEYFMALSNILTMTLVKCVSLAKIDDFVASKCGFTPQYKGLQELSDKFKNKLVVIGLPCNQFGNQEPGTSSEIVTFCEKNYGVKFLITEKIEVKGDGQHLLYKWLTNKNMNGKVDFGVKWNFQKYLIDEDGKMIDYFMSNTKPLSEKIVEIL